MNRSQNMWGKLITKSILGIMVLSISTSAKDVQNAKAPVKDVSSIRLGKVELKGIPWDSSQRHVVIPDPGPEEDAIRKGTHDHWLKTVDDPRYIIQQLHRGQPARGPHADEVQSIEDARRKSFSALRPQSKANPASSGLSASNGTSRAGQTKPNGNSGQRTSAPLMARAKAGKQTVSMEDWGVGMEGSGTLAGDGIAPNTFPVSYDSLHTASCGDDWEAFVTGRTASSASQASIVGLNNLYSACSGTVPAVYFAYEITEPISGDMLEAQSSPAISVDGTQLAFVATDMSATPSPLSYLVLLTWKGSSGTLATPVFPTYYPYGSTYYGGCTTATAPCYTIIPYANGLNSGPEESPYYDTDFDQLFVGDIDPVFGGNLHRFSPVFLGVPGEDTSNYPVALGGTVSTPVFDVFTCEVFAGTHTTDAALYAVSTPYSLTLAACGTASPYSVSFSNSGNIDGFSDELSKCNGVADSPFLVSGTDNIYVISDNNKNTGTPITYKDTVWQFSISAMEANCPSCGWLSNSTVGSGTRTTGLAGCTGGSAWSGDFDNVFYTTGDHGDMYVIGNHYGPLELYQIPISSGGGLGTSTVVNGTTLTSGTGTHGYGSPVTENCYNAGGACSLNLAQTETSTGTDSIILSVWDTFLTSGTSCTHSTGTGCIFTWLVDNPAAVPSTPYGSLSIPATSSEVPTGGLTIDFTTPTGSLTGSYFYTTTTAMSGSCPTSGTSPCAVQIPQ